MRILNIILVLIVLSFLFSCEQKKRLEIEFSELRGLTDTSKVVFKGIEVGKVEKIDSITTEKFIVHISVTKNFELPERADFIIYSRNINRTKGIGIKENNNVVPIDYSTIIKGQVEDSTTVNQFISIANELLEITKGDQNNKDSLEKELKRIERKIDSLEHKE